AWVLLAAGMLAHFQNDDTDAEQRIRESLDLFRSAGDNDGIMFALAELGVVAEDSGRYDQAAKLYEQVLELHRASGARPPAPYLIVTMYAHLGVACWGLGDRDRAVTI